MIWTPWSADDSDQVDAAEDDELLRNEGPTAGCLAWEAHGRERCSEVALETLGECVRHEAGRLPEATELWHGCSAVSLELLYKWI